LAAASAATKAVFAVFAGPACVAPEAVTSVAGDEVAEYLLRLLLGLRRLFSALHHGWSDHIRMLFQECLRSISALTESFIFVAVPGTALFDDVHVGSEIEEIAFLGNAFAVNDVEFDFFERRSHFIFHDLHASAIADDIFAVLIA